MTPFNLDDGIQWLEGSAFAQRRKNDQSLNKSCQIYVEMMLWSDARVILLFVHKIKDIFSTEYASHSKNTTHSLSMQWCFFPSAII